MTWGGLKPGIYQVSVQDSDKTVWDEEMEVGDNGRLALTADADAMNPLTINVACSEQSGQR